MTLLDPTYLVSITLLGLVYWIIPRVYRLQFLSLFSLTLLAYFSPAAALTLLAVTVICWTAARKVHESTAAYPVGLALLVLVFCAGNLVGTGQGDTAVLIGLSFYCLKAIHLLSEAYHNPALRLSLPACLAYVSFFPTLLIGPIHRYEHFWRDWLSQRWSVATLSLALERALWGYAKIVLVAGYLINKLLATFIISVADPALASYLENLRYGLHLYFSFAGASDIAIALSAVLGFRIPENFNWPFLSGNIADFWRRWHITLAAWCRQYIYGTTVAFTRQHQLATILTMLSIGLWHEFSVRYLLWGLYHGSGLVLHNVWCKHTGHHLQKYRQSRVFSVCYHMAAVLLTFNFVMLSFAITRSSSFAEVRQNFCTIFGFI